MQYLFLWKQIVKCYALIRKTKKGAENMNESGELPSEDATDAPQAKDILSFKVVGRPLAIDDLRPEFQAMLAAYGKPVRPVDMARVAAGSGTHLVKLVTPRAEKDHSIIRAQSGSANSRATFLPSLNAPDIPFAKIAYRPLEIISHQTKSLVGHILNPEDISTHVLDAFAKVFGDETLNALRDGLIGDLPPITKLPAGEFPIIFLPNPKGGDLQATPVSPAAMFMGFKRVADRFFQKQEADSPKVPRGKWHKQAISAKPQNISGAIGGPRMRFLSAMPSVLRSEDADLFRFAKGGAFPRWRATDVRLSVLAYAERVKNDQNFNNVDTRAALDRAADRLIIGALEFIDEIIDEVTERADELGIKEGIFDSIPKPSSILLKLHWGGGEQDIARGALGSSHFDYREQIALKKRGE